MDSRDEIGEGITGTLNPVANIGEYTLSGQETLILCGSWDDHINSSGLSILYV